MAPNIISLFQLQLTNTCVQSELNIQTYSIDLCIFFFILYFKRLWF